MGSKIQVVVQTKASIMKAVPRKALASSFSLDFESVISITASFTIMD